MTQVSTDDRRNGNFRIRPNGTCEYRLVYEDEFGKTRRKSFYGQSDFICLQKAEKFIELLEKMKMGIAVDATIPDIVKEKCKSDYEKNFTHEQGYARNLYTISLIEKSCIGDIPIADITERQIDLFLRSITHYSNSLIGKVFGHLKVAFKEAYSKGVIDKNIMELASFRCPKSSKKDKKVTGLTREEQNKLVNFLNEYKAPQNRNEYKTQILISLYSGMRMGEVNALKPKDIDFENGVIHVRATVSRGLSNHYFIKDGTKTDAGIRDIPIMDGLKPILEEAVSNAKENKQNLLFYDYEHDKLITTAQVNCFFKRACEKCGIKERGQHALRHTFATRCIEADIPAVVLKKWLGHTNIHITLDTYADVFSSMHNESILKLDNYINNISTQNQAKAAI